jgi:CBS-domain-containing membrane protein
MKRDWRRALREAISRNDHHNWLAGAVAGLGGAIAIGVMEWFSIAAHYPLAVIPFATSIVLVVGSPEVEPAQPRALIGGHLVTALVGFAVLKLTGPQGWAAAAAVGLASWQCTSPAPFTRLRVSTRCWWCQAICRGLSCWRRCWPARCF